MSSSKKRPVKTATLGGEPCTYEEESLLGEAWSYRMYEDHKNFIRISPQLKKLPRLDTVIHEAMHIQRPAARESTIERDASEIARLLWRLGYRRKGD